MNLSTKQTNLKKLLRKSLPYALFLLVMIVVLSLKVNLHVDEVYTYGLSNHMGGTQAVIEDGKTYTPENNPLNDYMTVQIGQRLEFGNVWENQINDVHPPLYYSLVHLVSSFFPNEFSIWFAGIVNIIFDELSLFMFRRVCSQLSSSKSILSVMTFMFIFSAGILMNISFLRMYVMAMFWVLQLTWLILYQLNGNESKWLYPAMFATAAAGALTHYYCIVYTVAISVIYCLYLLFTRKTWKVFLKYVVTMIFAAVCALLAFPAMLDHLFSGYRGTEAISNLATSTGYLKNLYIFLDLFNTQIFGGFMWIFGLAAICIGLFSPVEFKLKTISWKWTVILIPVLVYFLLIAKVAPYQTDRYMFPIYPLVMILVLIPVFSFLENRFSGKNVIVLSCCLGAVIAGFSLGKTTWFYLFRDSLPLLTSASNHKNLDAVYIYEAPWQVAADAEEMMQYKTATFVNASYLDELNNISAKNAGELIVNVPNRLNSDVYVEDISEKFGLGNVEEKLGSYGYGSTYLVGKSK